MSGEKQFKIVLLGEGRVGKTSLAMCYCQSTFNAKQVSTVQASCQTKRLNLDGQRVNLAVWDTAGQERFHALGPIYYRDANGALLVYDITDNDSFQRVQNWVKELRKMLGTDIVLTIAGNKCDLERNRVVSLETAEEYAASVGAKHFSTSAKLNKGVNELFLDLTQRMLKTASSSSSSHSHSLTSSSSSTSLSSNNNKKGSQAIQFEDDKQQPTSGSGCCS